MSCFYRSLLAALQPPGCDPTRRSRFTKTLAPASAEWEAARLSLEPTIGPSESESVGQSHSDNSDIIGQCRDTNSCHHHHLDIRNYQGLNVNKTVKWQGLNQMHHRAAFRTYSVSPMLKHLFHLLMQELCRANKQVKNGYLQGNDGRDSGQAR